MRPVLLIENLTKTFYDYDNKLGRIWSWFSIGKHSSFHTVLSDISFQVSSGESLGVIGLNGAGKSTLLKIISGVMEPTSGRVIVDGNISSILELGMGFYPDLSGRQNAVNLSKLMGKTQSEIDQHISNIERFADIGRYFEQPVRLYSSGMQMRVAFAIATEYEPDVLIVDEALSVGDVAFQHKCFDRIRELKDGGCSLLIVSHDKSTIQSICDRVILLDCGHVKRDSGPEEIFDYYNALISGSGGENISGEYIDKERVSISSGSKEVKIVNIELQNSKKQNTDLLKVSEKATIVITTKVTSCVDSFVMGYAIKDKTGQILFGTNTWYTEQVVYSPKINSIYKFSIDVCVELGVGSYSVSVALHDGKNHLRRNYDWKDLAYIFQVIEGDSTPFVGMFNLEQNIKIDCKECI